MCLDAALTACPVSAADKRPGSWRAHHNAIFDFCWSPCKGRLITAAGDQSVRMWDMERAASAAWRASGGGPEAGELMICRGHKGSVKSVAARPNDNFVFASGGRDGCVHIYDARQGEEPVMILRGAHTPTEGSSKRKRAGALAGKASHGVTSVIYLMDERNALATAGGTDGTIKLWDARLGGAARGSGRSTRQGNNGPRQSASTPLCTLHPDRGAERNHGITSLALDGTGGRLLASSTDGKILCYDTVRPDRGEIARFGGHQVHTFYVKARFSPDGRFVVSGSSDCNVYIWEVDRPDAPPIYLEGHESEVTGVDWNPADTCQLASCADDATVRVWRVHRGTQHRAHIGTPLEEDRISPTDSPAAAMIIDDELQTPEDTRGHQSAATSSSRSRRPAASTCQASLRDYFSPAPA